MNSLAVAAALSATASAFVAPNALRTSVSHNNGMTMSAAAKSKSLPFLPQPAALDGTMAGDVGFDPIGFSDFIPIDFLREAELKHGRICQLAVVGFITTDLGIHLPGAMHEVRWVAAHMDATLEEGGELMVHS